jgi:stage II sporulation protein GA (sporulation sigma-E factor processing peptidase)
MLVIYNYTNFGYYIAKVMNGEVGNLISIKLFLILSIVGTSILFLFTAYKHKQESYEGIIYIVEMVHDGKSTIANALMDTGNLLKDPISKRPVIICEKGIIEKIVKPHVLEVLIESNMGGYNMFDALRDSKVRMIPYNAVGNTNGMLVAITIDSVKITYNQNSITLCETLVAVYDKKLSQSGEFQMLLQPDLLKK